MSAATADPVEAVDFANVRSVIETLDDHVWEHRHMAYTGDTVGVVADPGAPLDLRMVLFALAEAMRRRDGHLPVWMRPPGSASCSRR